MPTIPARSLAALLVMLSGASGAARAEGEPAPPPAVPVHAHGTVFHDRDGDRVRDPSEEGLAGVRVSNGREVVATDGDGRFQLPVTDDTILFVIKPEGYTTPVDRANLPRFFYLHKPNGSPRLRGGGVKPTGPLPASIDFPLYPRREPDRFEVVLLGDPQVRNRKEVDYLARDVLDGLVGSDAAFGISLGDIVFDNLSMLGPVAEATGRVGIPWYNVLGNHDLNFDATDDRFKNETFERLFGPSYFAFDYGPVHFIVLDDVRWIPRAKGKKARYEGGLGEEQLTFIRNDLAGVPAERLVVLAMHVPLRDVKDRQALYRLIEKRPYTFSVSAHRHFQRHMFLDRKDGWAGQQAHHHLINVTACGSWWKGLPDRRGIPHATMDDGAPNGYSIVTFDGHGYTIDYRAAGMPATHQLRIDAPASVSRARAATTEVYVNVFAGSERSSVALRLGEDGPWTPMRKIVRPDPAYERRRAEEAPAAALLGLGLPKARNCHHLWAGLLPADPAPGRYTLHVRTTDMFGRTFRAARPINIEE